MPSEPPREWPVKATCGRERERAEAVWAGLHQHHHQRGVGRPRRQGRLEDMQLQKLCTWCETRSSGPQTPRAARPLQQVFNHQCLQAVARPAAALPPRTFAKGDVARWSCTSGRKRSYSSTAVSYTPRCTCSSPGGWHKDYQAVERGRTGQRRRAARLRADGCCRLECMLQRMGAGSTRRSWRGAP